MRQVKISIIVPVYKVEPYLEQCIRSLIEQTYRDIEIFLIDDGSPDRCGEICDAFAAEDERIRVIHQENQGVSAARNAGLDAASGEYVMFVDGDDWLENDCCEKALQAAEQKLCDIIYFREQENDESGEEIKTRASIGSFPIDKRVLRQIQKDIIARRSRLGGKRFATAAVWGKLYRKRVLTDNNCRFPVGIRKRQDVIFNIYCLEYLNSAYCLDYVGYHYRINSESICHKYNEGMIDILLKGTHVIARFICEKHPGELDYEKALGIGSANLENEIREIFFSHQNGRLPYKAYLPEMRRYCEDPVVAEYVGKCRLSDFETLREKIKYYFVCYRHYFMYYVFFAAYHRIKQVLHVR